MSELSIEGKVIEIVPVESGTSAAGKEWSKQEFVIETDDQYPKKVAFTLFGDKRTIISNLVIGNDVKVFFNLESREHNGRWFHNVNAWKVDFEESEGIPPEMETEQEGDVPF